MEFLWLVLLGLAGIALHLLMKLRDAVSKVPKDGLTVKERWGVIWKSFDFLGNILYSVYALIVVVVFVAIREGIEAVMPITKISIIFIGYFADSAIKNVKPEKLG